MKFFSPPPLSNSPEENSACPCGVQDILEPSHLLYYLCSKHRNLLPKNDDPNTSCSIPEIPVEAVVMNDPSVALPIHLCSTTGDTQYAYGYGPCLQLPSVYVHSQYYISEQEDRDSDVVYHPLTHDNDISSPKLCDMLDCLSYGNSDDILPYSKSKIFIETEVAAIKLQGLNS
jgi:hypothetical protein